MASVPTKTIKTIKILPGEKILLPEGVTPTSLVISGAISVESSCDNLPTPEPFICVQIEYALGANNSSSEPLESYDSDDVVVTKFGFGNNSYTLPNQHTNTVGFTGVNPIDAQVLAEAIAQTIEPGLIPYYVGSSLSTVGNRVQRRMVFSMPQSIADGFYIEMESSSFTTLRIYAKSSELCP